MTPACGEIVAVFADDTIAKVDVAGFDQLENLRLLPQLCARILIDQHRALAQVLELGGKQVVGDAVAGIKLLIVCKAIVLRLLRVRVRANNHACRKTEDGSNGRDAVHAHLRSSRIFSGFFRIDRLEVPASAFI